MEIPPLERPKSNSDARRLIEQKGIRLNGVPVELRNEAIEIKDGDILQRGKREFVRLHPARL